MREDNPIVYWTVCTIHGWRIHLAATDHGVCYIGSPNQPFTELEAWVKAKIPTAQLIQTDEPFQKAMSELEQYLHGKRQSFTIAKDAIGTDFQRAVWQASEEIPYGETRTYSSIAEIIGRPKAVRAVGTAIGANPLLFVIPCHRIIAKSGSLSGFRAGMEVKKELLTLEGT